MTRTLIRPLVTGLMLALVGFGGSPGADRRSQTVSGVVQVIRKSKEAADNGDVAVWLKAEGTARSGNEVVGIRPRPRILQQNKRFEPRFQIVTVGTVIDFPNADPFFHNVFSLFESKRFDLGLYEAGTSRSVTFTTPGTCYIFCNIHPEMSAVVVVVDTPYYASTNRAGEFNLPNVPPGKYTLSVWHERHKPERPDEFPRAVTIAQAGQDLGVIRLIESDEIIAPHKNKYGQDYLVKPSGAIYK